MKSESSEAYTKALRVGQKYRKEMISRAVNIGFIVFDGIMLAKKLDSKYAIVMKSIELIRKLKKK